MQITVARMCHATLEAIEQDVMDTAASDPACQRSVRRSWILLMFEHRRAVSNKEV
jgi:hypothetical protein